MANTTWGGYQSPDLDPREGDQPAREPVATLIYQDERSVDKNRIANQKREIAYLKEQNEYLENLLLDFDVHLCPSCGKVNDQRDPEQPCASCQSEATEQFLEGDR